LTLLQSISKTGRMWQIKIRDAFDITDTETVSGAWQPHSPYRGAPPGQTFGR